ncbi:sigma 54-interacting transcriptional regulator [Fibrobacter sp. UWEL]|uniref:sigma 54-interacting transcriptional regulator n=1 Tax=Fibrobacter sp. UWEL TaxID=1896209 RepID=UPI000916DFD5|nr:sigma-54 dependent transcriptional regulator [Fibrobacter sp. UWEL]SHK96549.1 two-component system, response regulator FlrC [Fibrobacter sp. UWEL]
MKQTENLLRIASNSNISVLLQGESGSGKEVAARYVHDHSKRCNGPFVALNCGAIAHSLTESILEGSRKGAFTGAVGDQLGVVRAANGGTLFLDEIGEMPLEAQCKLLRILQERSVMPLGATTNIPVDFRLICATNRNLRQEVASGRFREDLYFRLNVFPIKVPALRERKDFAALAQDIWREAVYSQEAAGLAGGFHPDAASGSIPQTSGSFVAAPLSPQEVQSLAVKPWPGNVRQLKNVLQRYALLGPYGTSLGEILRDEFAETLPPNTTCETNPPEEIKLYNPTPQWNILHEALQKNNWNKTVTAQKLGISRGSLCYHVRKHQDTTPRAEQS